MLLQSMYVGKGLAGPGTAHNWAGAVHPLAVGVVLVDLYPWVSVFAHPTRFAEWAQKSTTFRKPTTKKLAETSFLARKMAFYTQLYQYIVIYYNFFTIRKEDMTLS